MPTSRLTISRARGACVALLLAALVVVSPAAAEEDPGSGGTDLGTAIGSIVDSEAPNTSFAATPPTTTNSSTAAFEYASDDPTVVDYECALAAPDDTQPLDWQPCAAAYTVTEGDHVLYARAVDPAGNRDATPAEFSWTVDTTAPETSFSTTPDALTSVAPAAFVYASPDPDVVDYECALATPGATGPLAWQPCTATHAVADGDHVLQARAVDHAGNRDPSPAEFSWTSDTTAPETSFSATPDGLTNIAAAAFVYASPDPDVVSYDCALAAPADLGPLDWKPCAATHTVTDGDHVLHTRAVDHVGNSDPSPAVHGWTLDTVAPQVSINGGPSGTAATDFARFEFTASGNPAKVECSLDGAPFAACASPQEFSGLSAESHIFRVRATDAAGNSDVAERQWRVQPAAVNSPLDPFLPPPSQEPKPEPQPQPQQPSPRKPRPTYVSNERTRTYWSYVLRDSTIYARPTKKSKRVGRVGRWTYYGFDDVVIVLRRVDRWTQVRFSGYGNRTGWIWTGSLSRPRLTTLSVVIDRRRFTISAFRNGKRVLRARVGVGAKGSPTPAGRFFVRERLVPRDKKGIYGVLAFGTSSYSPFRTDWPGGGQVGIHGTNKPGLIPGRISNGCIRMRNGDVRKLDRIVRIGTPVQVR